MALTYSASGGLMTRQGHLFGGIADVVALEGGAATARTLSGASLLTRGATLETDAAASPRVSAQLDGHWTAIDTWRAAQGTLYTNFKRFGSAMFIKQVDLDVDLATKDLTSALTEMVRQMKATADSIPSSTIAYGAQTAVGSPTGNAKIVVSGKNGSGETWQTVAPETVRFTVTSDSQTGGATARNEQISIKGAPATTDPSSYLWQTGSSANQSINIVDAQADNARGNLLVNGDMETFTTSNYPDQFVIRIGAAGVAIQSNGSGYTLNNALKIVGDGSTFPALYTPFNQASTTSPGAGGTPAQLKPNTQYAVGFFLKASAAPSTGVLTVSLNDGTNTVTADAAGTNNTGTVDLTAATTSYVFHSLTFRTPTVLPATGLRLDFHVTTAIENGKNIIIDDIAFAAMQQIYNGGPAVAIFAGSTNVIKGDQWTVAVTNTMGLLAMWFERFYGLNALGLVIPNDPASPTIADSLVA